MTRPPRRSARTSAAVMRNGWRFKPWKEYRQAAIRYIRNRSHPNRSSSLRASQSGLTGNVLTQRDRRLPTVERYPALDAKDPDDALSLCLSCQEPRGNPPLLSRRPWLRYRPLIRNLGRLRPFRSSDVGASETAGGSCGARRPGRWRRGADPALRGRFAHGSMAVARPAAGGHRRHRMAGTADDPVQGRTWRTGHAFYPGSLRQRARVQGIPLVGG